MNFEKFALSEEILKGIKEMGFEEPSPIQADCIGPLLEGRDVIGQAQTGTGKTAAFGIPMLELVDTTPEVQGLILVPTRELAIQVSDELSKLGKYKEGIRVLPVYGGTDMRRQLKSLKKGVQIIVGTPGRTMDHLRRKLKLDQLKMVVLDEADEMFAMGFRDDMKTILDQTNEDKNTCFFSATMGKDIQNFSKLYQKDVISIKIKHKEVTVENIEQYYLEMKNSMKTEILSRLIDIHNPELTIVFANTKRMVDRLVSDLIARGYSADALHGDLKQNQRDQVMKKFRQGDIDILVATDVAARGIDVGNVDVVVNYDLPQDEEYYVHRIGRTARAGKKGKSFTFVSGKDGIKLQQIITYTKAKMEYMKLPTIDDMKENNENFLEKLILEELDKNPNLDRYTPIINRLLREEIGPVEIASVMMKLYDDNRLRREHQKLNQVDYGEKFEFNSSQGKKSSKRSNNSRNRSKKRNKSKKSRIFINKGRRDGVNKKVICGAITSETDLSASKIGKIDIANSFSFAEIPEQNISKVIRKLDGKKIKNKVVRVEKANS